MFTTSVAMLTSKKDNMDCDGMTNALKGVIVSNLRTFQDSGLIFIIYREE